MTPTLHYHSSNSFGGHAGLLPATVVRFLQLLSAAKVRTYVLSAGSAGIHSPAAARAEFVFATALLHFTGSPYPCRLERLHFARDVCKVFEPKSTSKFPSCSMSQVSELR